MREASGVIPAERARLDPAGGSEWIVEARGCDPVALASPATLQTLFLDIVADLNLHPIGDANWHQFPEPAGITGMIMLQESHLACHTFPEYLSLCLNLFCCRPREDWDFRGELHRRLGATEVHVRRLERPYR